MKNCTKEIRVRVEDVTIPRKHRPLNKDKLPIIATSMKTIGLKTPITVRIGKEGPVLVTGRHRLEAAKSLGWSHIPCIVMDSDKIERQQWAIAENLHRAGLTRLQRAEHGGSGISWLSSGLRMRKLRSPVAVSPMTRAFRKPQSS